MKLRTMPCRATQDGRVMVENSDKMWSTGERNAKLLQYSCLENQIANIHWIIEKAREFQKNIYFCFIDYAKVFVWITINCRKFWKRWEYQTTWPASWEICMQVKKQQLESDMVQTDWSQIGKGVHQGCILSPCLLTYMQSTPCKMPGWMEHKLE